MTTDDDATALADLFRLLGDPSRLRIVVSCLRTPLAVTDIADRLGLSVSLVSHHLRLLKGARLVPRNDAARNTGLATGKSNDYTSPTLSTRAKN